MTENIEELAHINGIPQKLVVFLHGYIDCAEAVDKVITQELTQKLENCAVHIPQAPIPCEIHERKRQWYSMHRFDPEDSRKTVPTMKKCAEVYNKMALGFAEAFDYLNPYIDNLLNEYQLDDRDLYICGFSQGAMLALYTSLMRENEIAGCVSFSGILAPSAYLLKHYKNTPPMFLIHGDADNLVRFAALDFTRRNLKKIGCPVNTHIVREGQHRITPDGLKCALRFINRERTPEIIKKAAG